MGQKMVVLPKNILKTVRSNPMARLLYTTDIGFYPYALNHYRSRTQGAGEYILIYCVEGKGTVKLGQEAHTITPNHYFIIPKKQGHSYQSDSEHPWSIYWIHFDGKLADLVYGKFTLLQPGPSGIPMEEERIRQFESLIELLERGYSQNHIEYATFLLFHLISTFIFHEEHFFTHRKLERDTLTEQIIDFLGQNLHTSLEAGDLTGKFNMSYSGLHAAFKRQTGYSIMNFFYMMKVQKACEHLNFTDLSVKEIGFKLGFNDPLYFSRFFKKNMGLSPSEYRKDLVG